MQWFEGTEPECEAQKQRLRQWHHLTGREWGKINKNPKVKKPHKMKATFWKLFLLTETEAILWDVVSAELLILFPPIKTWTFFFCGLKHRSGAHQLQFRFPLACSGSAEAKTNLSQFQAQTTQEDITSHPLCYWWSVILK